MAKDFAFLFKPGDYLRDTQCLSEKVQVAYDRIMCEHMRNICISQQQLNFFTKRLNEDEKGELLMVLNTVNGGYEIEWVAESIKERMLYSESRSKNRRGKVKTYDKHMKTYDKHMEGESESEDDSNSIDKNKSKKIKFIPPTIEDVETYFGENGYSIESAQKAFNYYALADWHDSKGNKIKNWKQKMQGVWFKDENKQKVKWEGY